MWVIDADQRDQAGMTAPCGCEIAERFRPELRSGRFESDQLISITGG
jgi:hypothetical protein